MTNSCSDHKLKQQKNPNSITKLFVSNSFYAQQSLLCHFPSILSLSLSNVTKFHIVQTNKKINLFTYIDNMPLNCSSVAIKLPHGSGLLRRDYNKARDYLLQNPKRVAERVRCVSSDLKQSSSSLAMEEKSEKKTQVGLDGDVASSSSSSSGDKKSFGERELEVGVMAVQMACALCKRAQEGLISKTGNGFQSKDDNSPVTIADWSVQATVSWVLSEAFGGRNVSIVAEEDTRTLSEPRNAGLLRAVAKTVNESLADAPRFGLSAPDEPLGASEVLEAIGRCNSNGGPRGRFWALDPVDGTLGFVRGDQYAIALALIENGEVVLGVLGCPNYPMRKEWLSYHHRYHRIVSKLTPSTASESWDKGCVIYAERGSGEAWMQPLLRDDKKFAWPNSATPVRVSSVDNPSLATFCEPVEKANSSHSFTAGLAHSVGLRKQPLRVYSMVKYAAIARGDAEIFMKFARAGYKEKIWDHAAGVVIIREAGGVVTDAGGRPLDFSQGIYLEGLDRGIIASAGAALHDKIIRAVDASWDSSAL